LCILYTNVDPLLNKIDELKLLVHDVKPDVICVTEVCPKRNIAILDSEIQISYYEVAAPNLQECGRGCIIYVKTGCENQQISPGADSAKIEPETLFIKVSDVVFGFVYRSPSQTVEEKTRFLHLLNTAFTKLTDMKHLMYMLGDFNFQEIIWDENQTLNHPLSVCSKTIV
jgi:exonuclease III